MHTESVSCDVDATWQDVRSAFAQSLSRQSTWSCTCLPTVDREAILSAPEVMDTKTDASCGCATTYSLDYSLSEISAELCTLAELTNSGAIVDLLDVLLCKELYYLQGYSLAQSVLAFPFFLRLDMLRESNFVLYAYCRGVLCCLDRIVQAIFATSIRSDEEFLLMPPEVARQADVAVDVVLADLDDAISRTQHNALSARLRFRRSYLYALHRFVDAESRNDVEVACATCYDLSELLNSTEYARTCEPTVGAARLLCEREVAYWVSALTPVVGTPPSCSFVDVVYTYRSILAQLASLRTLYTLPSLRMISEYVEQFAAQQPLLPVRCIAALVLLRPDPMVSFLHCTPLPHRVVCTLATDYGAPLYMRVYSGDDECVERIAKYRISNTGDLRNTTPNELAYVCQQTIDTLRRWVAEASKHYLLHLETLLCNRGLAHRRLVNAMPGLAQFYDMSYFVDATIFLAGHTSVSAHTDAYHSKYSSVLTLFAAEHVLRTMELILHLLFELNMLTPGEVPPALWYVNFLQRARAETMTLLCLRDTAVIPAPRVNKRSQVPLHNMALCTRTAVAPDIVTTTVSEAARMLSDVVFVAAALYEHKQLIKFNVTATYGLMRADEAFDHRLFTCFGPIRSPPYMPYAQCIHAKTRLQADATGRVQLYARKASEAALATANKIRMLLRVHDAKQAGDAHTTAMTEQPSALVNDVTLTIASGGSSDDSGSNGRMADIERARVALLRPQLLAIEKTARCTAASLATFVELCNDDALLASYEACVERPAAAHLVTLVLRKKVNM